MKIVIRIIFYENQNFSNDYVDLDLGGIYHDCWIKAKDAWI